VAPVSGPVPAITGLDRQPGMMMRSSRVSAGHWVAAFRVTPWAARTSSVSAT
jgi:hypothetical protein